MTIKHFIVFIIVFIVLVGLKGCKTQKSLSHQELNYLYDETKFQLNPEYLVFHHSEAASTLFYKINPDELLYEQTSEGKPHKANYRIKYNIFSSFDSEVLVDSSSVDFTDTLFYKSDLKIIDSLIVDIPPAANFIMQVKMFDLNSQAQSTNLLEINKSDAHNFQYYKVYDENQVLQFLPKLPKSGEYTLQYSEDISKEAYIRIYSGEQSVAAPPFAEELQPINEIKADTVFQINFENGVATLPVELTGLYNLNHNNNEVVGGTSMYYYHEGFPYLVEEAQKLPPLRYLTTGEEFETLKVHPDAADAVDIFWTAMAGTQLRGEKAIDSYYNNVQKSNKFFTTWKQGWKTDRGMIYSVFGQPDRIYKDDYSEKWTYRDSWHMPVTEFYFEKTEAPLGKTCYELIRKPGYKNPWFQVVDKIRR